MFCFVVLLLFLHLLSHQQKQKLIIMKTFKNINFKSRDYECTNIVFCFSENAPNSNWIECSEFEISKMKCEKLYSHNGIIYYGYM